MESSSSFSSSVRLRGLLFSYGFFFLVCWGSLLNGARACRSSSSSSAVVGEKEKDPPSPDKGGCTECFLGIRYGLSPTGPLRFRPPVAAAPLSQLPPSPGQFGPVCPQKTQGEPYYANMAEDCLFLNVFAPCDFARQANHSLSVMVFIHGGSFVSGASSVPIYNGQDIASQALDTLVVTVNYRLGALGWLSVPSLQQEAGFSGNYGLMDQVAALQWVKRNIHLWNGDRNKVTVFGESAGAMSICALLVTPLNNGLFQRAIMESGQCHDASSLKKAGYMGNLVATNAGCANSTQQLACLRAAPWKALLGGENWGMTIDDYFLSSTPLTLMQLGEVQPHVAEVLLGTNADEGTFFYLLPPNTRQMTAQTYEQLLDMFFQEQQSYLPAIRKLYAPLTTAPTGSPDISSYAVAASAILTAFFVCPSLWTAAALSKTAAVPTYMYNFVYHPSCEFSFIPPWLYPFLGAFHSSELPYVFDTDPSFTCQKDKAGKELSFTLIDLWCSFARTGNPNPGPSRHSWGNLTDLTWPAFNSSLQSIAVLNNTLSLQHGVSPEYHCDFWAKVWGQTKKTKQQKQ